MASQPAQLPEKIAYLHQKIDYLNEQVRYTTNFQLKKKFLQFVDSTIESIYQIQDRKQYSSQVIRSKNQAIFTFKQDESQKKRLQVQKNELTRRLKQLSEAEQKIELDTLKIQLENNKILKNSILKEASSKEFQLKKYITQLEKKIKNQERQIEKLNKMNSIQMKEIENAKEDKIRAEKRESQWREKYHNDLGSLEAFKDKKNKYLYRHEEGLKIVRSIANVTTEKKGCQRLIFCDLPLKFHVIKLAYGIKVGVINNDNQIEYFHEIGLFEKEDMQLFQDGNQLTLHYVKRKDTKKLKHKLPKNQVVIMLFGKGDSVGIDQSH